MNLRFVSLLGVAILFLASSAQAQQTDFFETFHFKEMKFKFYPKGLENRGSSDGKGSAITVSANEVKIEGEAARELRHCMDKDDKVCTYDTSLFNGNKDGTVTANEVASFQSLAQFFVSSVDRVKELVQIMKTNVTVDALTAKTVQITRLNFQGAEGPTDAQTPVLAFIDAKVTYDNDPAATRHLIKVQNVVLKPGFIYESVAWESADAAWHFDTTLSKPAAAKALTNAAGYFSTQDQFEGFTQEGFEQSITSEKVAGAKKKSPGLEPALVLLALAALAVVVRRRT